MWNEFLHKTPSLNRFCSILIEPLTRQIIAHTIITDIKECNWDSRLTTNVHLIRWETGFDYSVLVTSFYLLTLILLSKLYTYVMIVVVSAFVQVESRLKRIYSYYIMLKYKTNNVHLLGFWFPTPFHISNSIPVFLLTNYCSINLMLYTYTFL